MEEICSIVLYLYFGLLGLFLLLYFPRILFYFAAFLPIKRVTNTKKNHLAVVVAAKREGKVVEGVLSSLMNQDYDPAYFDIYVIVDGKDDPTAVFASSYQNIEVINVPNQKNKGEALDGGLKAILHKKANYYDAYVFIDADNIASRDFLTEMNNALALDKQIVIGKKLIKNFFSNLSSSRSYSSDSTSLTYTQIDDLGNRARDLLDAPITLVGTGMMVRKDVIELNNGWPYRSLTEDYELGADAIVKGWTSYYYPYAKVYTEEATSAKGAYRRRIRWIKGYSQVHSRYRKKIWKKKFPRGKNWIKFGYVFGRLPVYGIFGTSFLTSFVGLILLITAGFLGANYQIALLLFLVPLAISYILLALFNLIAVLADRDNLPIGILGKISLITLSPFYNLTYLPIYLTCLFTPYDYFTWEKTPRIPFEERKNKKEEKK